MPPEGGSWGCLSPGESPLASHLAWFASCPCHFTGGSVTNSYLSFKPQLRCCLLWSLWGGSQAESKKDWLFGNRVEFQLCHMQTTSSGCYEDYRVNISSIILSICEMINVCLRWKHFPRSSTCGNLFSLLFQVIYPNYFSISIPPTILTLNLLMTRQCRLHHCKPRAQHKAHHTLTK
jgi:hypothetical protein